MIKRILVGLGIEPFAAVATRYGVELASAHGAELTGVAVVDLDRLAHIGAAPIGASAAIRELREHRINEARRVAQEVLGRFESECQKAGLRCQVQQVEGDPVKLMISSSRYHDLLISSPQGLFEHGVLEEGPEELIPLVIEGVRPILALPGEYRRIQRVLIAYSGTMGSAKTMKRFMEMNLWSDIQVRIVTFTDGLSEEADQLLSDAAQYVRAYGIQPEIEAVPGSPVQQIVAYSVHYDADMIVVGNSMKSLLRRRLFGETTLELLRHSDRPLFLSQ